MAEAFGIAGSAVGIVSLGLQLYGGITTYFDALEGREDDLASARAQLGSLRSSLVTIQSVLPPSASATASTGSSTAPPIVRECEKELNQLDTLLQELAGSSTSSKKLKDRVKTLRFPFRRDNLMKLEDRLHKTNAVFQTALIVFHLDKSLANEQKLANVEAATMQIPAINTAVTSLTDNFEAFAPEAISRLGEVRSSLDMVARQDDIRELSRISENNTDLLSRVDLSVAQMAAMTENKLALIESSAQNLASSEDRILQKLASLENLLGLQGADERRANPPILLRRVLAKPSQTRELLDGLSASWPTGNHSDSSFQKSLDLSLSSKFQGLSCSCLRHKHRQGTSQNFGPFWLRTESSYHGHSQTCQLFHWNLGKQRRWFELTTVRRSSFWSWALGVSFAITTGAGGLSISPNLTYRPVVEQERSPVFRVLNALQEFFLWGSGTRLSQTDVSRCLSAVASMILTLYQEKKAFPYEVDARGESAVYKLVVLLCDLCSSPWCQAFSEFVLWAVIEADFPANICDFSGRTPVMEIALMNRSNQGEVLRLFSVLYGKAPESVISRDMLNEWGKYDAEFSIKHLHKSLPYSIEHNQKRSPYPLPENDPIRIHSEILGYGPISTAIFARYREEQINDLIDAISISEVSLFGQTPLHLAVGTGNVDVLTVLLQSTHVLSILHLRDVQGNHAIGYAVHNSNMCGHRWDSVPCSGCNCSDALQMLLCVAGYFDGYLESITDAQEFGKAVRSGSLRKTFLLMSELKLRRDQLKQLALAHLDDKDIQRYKLDRDDVLDYHGIDVVERLDDMGIKVPTTLKNSFIKSACRRSIYHNLSKEWIYTKAEDVAQLIFDLGFHDTDGPDELGYTPLMMACRHSAPTILLWFVEHGADVTLRDPCIESKSDHHAHVNPTVAQQVSEGLRERQSLFEHQSYESASPIVRVVPVATFDDCVCYCTEGGCSPASILFQERWEAYEGVKTCTPRLRKTLGEVGSDIISFLERDSLDLTSRRHVCLAAIRMLTFEALGISHTCGCRDIWKHRLSSDEIEELWDEEAHLIGCLEDMLAEFTSKFDTLGIDCIAFLILTWVERLENVLKELDGYKLSEAERTGAEALGVRWQAQQEAVEAEVTSDYDTGMSVDDFFRELRKIEKE